MKKNTIGNYFNKMKEKANNVLESSSKTGELVTNAENKTTQTDKQGLRELGEQVKALVRLVRSYKRGDYRNISKKSMLLIVASLLYFVSPIDAVPDFLIGAGLLDDATVLAFLFKTLSGEIAAYQTWEKTEEDSYIKPAP
ncbi:YkvA family protein [Bacillus sp. NEB1478]|uniref:YkvA family protein n=1 Tax=Bacillus sp. NEB1478 TaxID=3073816 RepID=UPI002873CBFD|nr:YkvA family protein [Bacillus sp. NEB1478]WNB91445.1 YkvA family protein [Bacillus sp. NEB1478]